MYNTKAYSATSATSPLASTKIARRDPNEHDVQIKILFCGICHCDLHCAGITTYSPMRHWGVTKGKKVGVVGLGELGHMTVKFAHALGAHVVVFTTSPGKKEDALRLGADEVVVSRNNDEMQKHAGSFDFILDTVSAEHDINAYINLLCRDGNITLVGAPEKPLGVSSFALITGRRSLSGSNIGGLAETQEMLDFCAEHGITADADLDSANQRSVSAPSKKRREVPFRHRYGIPEVKVMIHAKQTSATGRPIHPNIFSVRSIQDRHERSHVQRFPNSKSAIGFDDNHPYGDSSGGAYAA